MKTSRNKTISFLSISFCSAVVILFLTTVASADPPVFIDFSPSNGAIDIELINPELSWSVTDPNPVDIITYDIYLGTSVNPPKIASNHTSTSYQAGLLFHFTTYYWKIVARDNHGNETIGPILSFRTRSTPPQFISFSPSDGATGVSLTPTLTWSAADPDPDDTLVYDIYFGTSSPLPLVLANQTATSYNPGQLNYQTVYDWKVVARDNHGAQTELPILFFRTPSTPPQFISFSPSDGATGVSLTPTLTWSAADPDPDDALVYDIYFGTTDPPPLVIATHPFTSYRTGQLNYQTIYYWRVVAHDLYGAQTESQILSFVTLSSQNPVIGKILGVKEPGLVIWLIGTNFGDTQGDSVVHIGPKTFDSSSPRIKLWSDTKIRIRLPNYQCGWFQGQDYRYIRVWVTMDGVDSNRKRIKVLKPSTCP